LVTLAKGLSNQFFVSPIPYSVNLVSISLFSVIIFIISFNLLLGLCYSWFSKTHQIVWELSNFPMLTLITINFPLKTSFAVYHKLWS
jgi:hypothetical protein